MLVHLHRQSDNGDRHDNIRGYKWVSTTLKWVFAHSLNLLLHSSRKRLRTVDGNDDDDNDDDGNDELKKGRIFYLFVR